MQQKVFDSIVKNIFGKQAGELASLLFDKPNMNEFLVAKKLQLTPNQARNILYKFSHMGFASFIKKKDKRKGWYTYFWSIDSIKILNYIKRELETEIRVYEDQIKTRATQRFYVCPICKVEIPEEEALLHDFSCPECGHVYELSSGEKVTVELKTKLKSLTHQLGIVSDELAAHEAVRSKKEERIRKKQQKEKEKEREKARKKRARERAKLKPKKKKPKKAKKKAKKKSTTKAKKAKKKQKKKPKKPKKKPAKKKAKKKKR